jgi:hypothetical protein
LYGPVVEQGIWRIRTIGELMAIYKDIDIAAEIKKNRMEWTEYVVRIDHGRTVKNYLRVNRREVEDLNCDCWKM